MQELMLARLVAFFALLALVVPAPQPYAWKPQGRFGKRGDISLPLRGASGEWCNAQWSMFKLMDKAGIISLNN